MKYTEKYLLDKIEKLEKKIQNVRELADKFEQEGDQTFHYRLASSRIHTALKGD